MSKDLIAADDFSYGDFGFYERNNFAESPVFSSQSHERVSRDRSELFSDLVLDYINQMLLEEDLDDKYDTLQSHPDLEATEKPFYELIGEKYPSSPDQLLLHSSPSSASPDSNPCQNSRSSSIQSFQDNSEFPEYQNYQIPLSDLLSSRSSVNGGESDILFKTVPVFEFEKGIEEAKKFLPSEDKLVLNVGEIDLSFLQYPVEEVRSQKNRHWDESGYEDTRRIKQSAVFYEDPVIPSEMFDDVLLCSCERFSQVVNAIREKMFKEAGTDSKNSNPNESGVHRKSRRKKQQKEVVDFNTLLVHCAQTVSSGDKPRADELLKQIRQHSSPYGDASQRLAHYFANGLEARLAGTGTEVYHSLVSKRRTVGDVLKAYQLYLACCPFKKITYHFANQTILDTIQHATRVHIVDFGIYFGFQWPSFIKQLSDRPGGPPKLRITGIDIPEPGFRPIERIQETGRRLAEFAERFGVRFEYHAVAALFDEVRVEDLHIEDDDEMLVVNCLFRLHDPADETVTEDCPRDMVLNTIRKLNPAVFVNAVMNGTYGAPFFMSRFREALYYFSAIFDMLDSTAPRENEQRMLIERDLYGKRVINVIACEGLERERPETYKQWQVRILRAGFEQLSISKEYVKQAKLGVKTFYHKDFNMDEDGKWLLEGWKGRIFYGISAWKPTCF